MVMKTQQWPVVWESQVKISVDLKDDLTNCHTTQEEEEEGLSTDLFNRDH